MTRRILWLRERIGWMGHHSGYDPICDVMSRMRPGGFTSVWVRSRPDPRLAAPVLRRLRRRARGSPFYNPNSLRAELAVFARAWQRRPTIVHATYVENQLALLATYRDHLPGRLVGTAHQPASWYRLRHRHPEALARLDAVITLGSAEVAYLETLAPGRVHFVPYGVDLAFFRPRERQREANGDERCLFGGKWLRDVPTLVRVVELVLARNSRARFDLLVPLDARASDDFRRLTGIDRVRWHAGLSDEALRDLYRASSLLLLPMLDCVGNSVLLEAIACGLPVISSDVGALRDYTRPDFADLLPCGDAEGMAEAVLRLLDDPEERLRRARAARAFAEAELDWRRSAAATLEVYEKVLQGRGNPCA